MDRIPDGFKKMKLVLTFRTEHVEKIENMVLFFLIRDWYIFYSKKDKFGDGEYIEFHFYCRPEDEVSITYALGCYLQAVLGLYSEKSFENPIHRVPDGFPRCIHIEMKNEHR